MEKSLVIRGALVATLLLYTIVMLGLEVASPVCLDLVEAVVLDCCLVDLAVAKAVVIGCYSVDLAWVGAAVLDIC